MAKAPAAGDEKTLALALKDDQWEARRIAARIAGAGLRAAMESAKDARLSLIIRALGDADWHVRYEAASAFARNQDAPNCAALLRAVGDRNTHVALLAIDQLSRCQAAPASEVARVLGKLARAPSERAGLAHSGVTALLQGHVQIHRISPVGFIERLEDNPVDAETKDAGIALD